MRLSFLPPFRFALLALLALALGALTAAAADPSGIWKLKVTGPNGGEVDSTLTLTWADNQLKGTLENRNGRVDIEKGTFSGDKVSFTVTRRVRVRKLTTTYSGQLAGDKMTGTLETTLRSRTLSAAWEADRQSTR